MVQNGVKIFSPFFKMISATRHLTSTGDPSHQQIMHSLKFNDSHSHGRQKTLVWNIPLYRSKVIIVIYCSRVYLQYIEWLT